MFYRRKSARVCAFQVPQWVTDITVNYKWDGIESARSEVAVSGDWLVFTPGGEIDVYKDDIFKTEYERDNVRT